MADPWIIFWQYIVMSLDGFTVGLMLQMIFSDEGLKTRKAWLHVLIITLANFAICLPSYMMRQKITPIANMIVYGVILFVCTRLWYRIRPRVFFGFCGIYAIGMVLTEICTMNLVPSEIVKNPDWTVDEMMPLCMAALIVFGLYKVFAGAIWSHWKRNRGDMQELVLIFGVAGCALILGVVIIDSVRAYFDPTGPSVYGAGSTRMLANSSATLAILFCLYFTWHYRKHKEKLDLLRQMSSLQNDYSQTLLKTQNGIEDLYQSAMLELTDIEQALVSGQSEKAADIISTFVGHLEASKAPFYCVHPTANALMIPKAAECKEAGIDLRTNLKIPEDIHVDALDLCRALGNMLDNAIRANRQLGEGSDLFIELNAFCVKGVLNLECVNPYRPENKNRIFGTGLGQQVLKDLARHYHGSFTRDPSESGLYSVELNLCMPSVPSKKAISVSV